MSPHDPRHPSDVDADTNLDADPPRDPLRSTLLARHDARHQGATASRATPLPELEARLRERVAAAMAAHGGDVATPAAPAAPAAADVRRASDEDYVVALARTSRRLLPAMAVAASAAFVYLLSMSARGPSVAEVRAVAYAGGAEGAAVALTFDDILGIPSGSVMLAPGGGR